MLKIALIVVAAFTVIATLMAFLRKSVWWVRAFDFPRLQIASLGVLVLIAYPFVFTGSALDIAIMTGTALATAWQFWRILPYTPVFPKQVKEARNVRGDDTISVVVANVLTPNRGAARLVEIIRAADPDVILAVETDTWWEQQLSVLEKDYPHTIKCPQDNLYGMHLYSRLDLKNPQLRFLVEEGIPSMHAQVLMRNGHEVELHCLHPAPPSPTENETSKERDGELLLVGRDLQQRDHSTIVCGDLNDVAWSNTTNLFQKISGLLDPRIGRGRMSTFHAKYWFARWPLDHLFHSDDFTLVAMRRLPKFGSDHFPIHVVLHYEPPAQLEQDGPHADREERVEAEQKIREVDAEPL